MKYVYKRVSTSKQSLATQSEALAQYNGVQVEEKISGAIDFNERPEFSELDKKLVAGDTVIVYDLSRLGRNTQDLLSLVDDWKARKINLVVHNLGGDTVDTNSATGYLLFTVLAAIAQMQRDLQNEKIQLGVDKAKADGKMKGGVAYKSKQIELAIKYHKENGLTKDAAAKAAGIGVATLYRALK